MATPAQPHALLEGIDAWLLQPLSQDETAQLLIDLAHALDTRQEALAEPVPPSRLSKRLLQALDIICARPGLSVEDLRAALDTAQNNAYQLLHRLKKLRCVRVEYEQFHKHHAHFHALIYPQERTP